MKKELAIAEEDYLAAIYRYTEKLEDIGVTTLTKCLGIKKSSVSEMLKKLVRKRLVNHKHYGKVTLTKKGEAEACKLVFKHRLIELFLTKILKHNAKEVHNEAHMLEHAFSERSISEIYKMLGKPKKGIHEENIPMVNI